MATATDISKTILAKLGEKITTWKLHKLAYYAQAWSLAERGKALFDDEFYAYPKGPLLHSVFVLHGGNKWIRESMLPTGDISAVNSEESSFIDSVIQFYGKMEPAQLVQLTHCEQPWIDAYSASEKSVITKDSMIRFYRGKTFDSTVEDCQVYMASKLHGKHEGLMARLAQ